jgi:hypothetical protein
MILDLVGGILSLFQLVLEAIVLKDASLITGLNSQKCLKWLANFTTYWGLAFQRCPDWVLNLTNLQRVGSLTRY